MTTKPGLLAGITVCDFSWAVAGPALTRFLAHHGATVIKIETNTKLDATRMSPPFKHRPSRNLSGYFDQWSAGKLSITLNLKNPGGQQLAFRLAVAADLVNENFSAGVLDALGLGYESLRQVRPGVILVSSSTQGQTGPNAAHPGLGVTLQGLVGLSELTGWPDREPAGTGEPYTDTLVPWFAGTAVMAALDYRRRTGLGGHVDLSQFETAAHAFAPALVHGQLTGVKHTRMGNASLGRAPEGVYPCRGKDRWLALSVEDDAQWAALARVIGFAHSPAQTAAWRLEQREALDAAVAAWSREQEAEAAQELLQAACVPAHLVATGGDLFNDPQLAARGRWVMRDHPAIGEHVYDLPPFRLAEHEIRVARSPLIGEHTDEVLRDYLGLSIDEITAARESGALT